MKGNDDIGLESMITDANFFVEVNQISVFILNCFLQALFDSLAQGGPDNGSGGGISLQVSFLHMVEERAPGGAGSNIILRANLAWMT